MPTIFNKDQVKLDFVDREPAEKEGLPTGPYKQADETSKCSLLIFVPRNTISALINETTGAYGYSHLAVDCGELDIPTGKRVMIESTFGLGVHSSFQDEYGGRKFVRIPLENTGVNIAEFCDCVRSKLGEKFDYEEVLTIGLLHNPAQQICSDLATVCLPDAMRTSIARYHQAGFLRHHAALRLHGGSNKTVYLFVTPNGFAEYFGAPKGEQLEGPDQLTQPKLPIRRIFSWHFCKK